MTAKENSSVNHDESEVNSSDIRLAYIVEESENPSSDYFVVPMLKAKGFHVVRCGFRDLPTQKNLTGAVVVFVRYVPSEWMKLVNIVNHQLSRIVFFMDDDVLDISASSNMPLRYRFKLARLAARHKKWLQNKGVQLWVSTPYLQQRYADWQPQLVLPTPIEISENIRRVFYHGSASHNAEVQWLRPVMEQVLLHDDRVAFEIIGGRDVHREYRGLPRVTVVNQMSWPAYRSFLSMSGRHIGLAPLLDTMFNRARSYTKFFDITHSGAVGIYSAGSANAEVISDGVDGVIVKQEQSEWVEAILNLVDDESLRKKILKNAEDKIVKMSDMASRSSDGVMLPQNDDIGYINSQI